ncbi:MAG: hypothetical protein JNM18_25545 [Planctomycetaceae bacterium]|nr:hypothetical protein [Planctomycetaceae bacterium]
MVDVGEFVAQAKTKLKLKKKGQSQAMTATIDDKSTTPGKESAGEKTITHPGVDQMTAVAEVLARVASEKKIADPAWLVRYGAMASADGHGGACLKIPAYSPTGEYRALFKVWADNPTLEEKLNKTLRKGVWREGDSQSLFLPQPLGWKDWTTPRLPKPGESWHVVEGAKDACVLAGEFGLSAIGLPGCDCPNINFEPMLAGCRTTLVLDGDFASVIGNHKTAQRLHAAGIETYVVTLPVEVVPKHGADCRDVLAMDGGKALLQNALDNALPWVEAFAGDKLKPIIDSANKPSPTNPAPASSDFPPIATPLSIWDEAGRTDVANGKRFAARFKDDLRWCEQWQKWLWWDGTRWAVDRQRKVELLAKQLNEELLAEIAAGAESHDREETRAAFRFVLSLGSQRRLEAMIKLARSEPTIPIVPDQLDADPWSLNCHNGTINLRSMELRSHQRGDLITRVVPHAFDPEAPAPLWRKFVREIFNDDHELIDFVRRLVGYSITGSTTEHVLPICYGTGCNGKSLFLNSLLHVTGGDYGLTAEPRLLMASASEQHPTGVADLHGRRFVAALESAQDGRLNENAVKILTGGDRVRARRMREDFWEFAPSHHIWLATNHRPAIRGTDRGIWRRLKLIPFTQSFEGREDRQLGYKLQAEATGILAWAVFGAYSWHSSGLHTPSAVEAATGQYRAQEDALGAFIESECVVDQRDRARAGELYGKYAAWCERGGERAMNQRAFGVAMTERGFDRVRNNGMWYLGIGIAAEPQN